MRERGALAIAADASNPADLEQAIARTREEHGSIDLIVNAVTASRAPQGGPWGGGPIAEGTMDAVPRLDRRGRRAGVRVPVDRRPRAARGRRRNARADHGRIVAPGDAGPRPVGGGRVRGPRAHQAAAQELRGQGVHVALLIVDATIESPKTG